MGLHAALLSSEVQTRSLATTSRTVLTAFDCIAGAASWAWRDGAAGLTSQVCAATPLVSKPLTSPPLLTPPPASVLWTSCPAFRPSSLHSLTAADAGGHQEGLRTAKAGLIKKSQARPPRRMTEPNSRRRGNAHARTCAPIHETISSRAGWCRVIRQEMNTVTQKL